MADPQDPTPAFGDRLRAARRAKHLTLADAAVETGISVSTLSRLENGARRATLELLLPLADLYDASLDELVGRTPPPRKHPHGRVIVPLTKEPGGLRAYKMLLPPPHGEVVPELRTHEGWEWMYVLSGRLRAVLAEHDMVLVQGDAMEFDTHVPHWFDSAGPGPTEVLTLFGPQGERVHVRARSRGVWGAGDGSGS
ncbi:XRE family transcriptional regulator [Catenulispora yoronensis]|uniref:XRE family transcriptional regulator n=1 Tax=Catenulispora yoronensis TaxID=450799 RepID=A0ABP5F3E6_9ACTN